MNSIETLTVYLGSSGHARPVYQEAAQELGKLIGEKNYKLVYGGMDAGLMGLLAMSALNAGGHVTGIIPQKLKDSERILENLSETVLVEDLWERKKRMFNRADAIISLPGGFGTLDESLEVLYWGALKLHSKPLVLVNIEGYWNSLIAYLKTLPDYDAQYLIVVDHVNEIFEALEKWSAIDIPEKLDDHLPHFEDEITRDTNDPILIDKASVENTYYAVCALGLKQLAKHKRAVGFLNENGQFNDLLTWFQTAQKETFITPKCLDLYAVGDEESALRNTLKTQDQVEINLHTEKWGERRKVPRD